MHHPAGPACFEQTVLVDALVGFVQQNRKDCHAGTVKRNASPGDRQPAARGVELDLAETRQAAVHARSPPMPSYCRRPAASRCISPASNQAPDGAIVRFHRSEEPTSERQSLMRTSYAVFCLKKKTTKNKD